MESSGKGFSSSTLHDLQLGDFWTLKLSASVHLHCSADVKMIARRKLSVSVGGTLSGPTHFGYPIVLFSCFFFSFFEELSNF
jgi:hypothetical protein